MSQSRDATLTKEEQAVLDIVKAHRALISAMPWDANDQYIDENYLDQLADPTKNRPSRSAQFFEKRLQKARPDVLKKINLKTFKIHDHKAGQCRETKHKGIEFTHTAKTATSLIPPEPQYMILWGGGTTDSGVGFLWDIDACNLKKEKYVFAHNAKTDDCFWLDVDSDEKIANLKKQLEKNPPTSIEFLRERNNKAVKEKHVINWNEILAGLPRGRIDAVFSQLDTRKSRLRAWDTMLHAKEKLNFNINIW